VLAETRGPSRPPQGHCGLVAVGCRSLRLGHRRAQTQSPRLALRQQVMLPTVCACLVGRRHVS
jgi:hypothetical protein